MKFLAPIALVLGLSSCSAMQEILNPVPVVQEDGSVVPVEQDPRAVAVGEAAGDVVGILTGNQLLDMLVTTLVGGALGWYIRKRKPAAPVV